jgi:hypothetical protein
MSNISNTTDKPPGTLRFHWAEKSRIVAKEYRKMRAISSKFIARGQVEQIQPALRRNQP